MRIDTQVSKQKFKQEVQRLKSQAEVLKSRGVLIQKIHYPNVEAVFIPQNNFTIYWPIKLPPGTPIPPPPPELQLPPGAEMPCFQGLTFQNITSKAFGVKVLLDNFDQLAPSVSFYDPVTWEELPFSMLTGGILNRDNNPPINVLIEKHPLTRKPFLCMSGIREYHNHPQHTGDDWMRYRKHVGLFSTLETIWRVCIKNVIPKTFLQIPNTQNINVPSGVN